MRQIKHYFMNKRRQKLAGLIYAPDKRKEFPIVIVAHGYRSTKDSTKVKPLATLLAKEGIGVFAFDFSGRGESEGKFEDTTITKYIQDLDAAIGFCSKKTKKIGVVGISLGGLVSLQESAKDKRIKGLVLMSPVSYFPWRTTKEFSKKAIHDWKNKGYSFTKSDRYGLMKINYAFYEDGIRYQDYDLYKKIKVPTMIFHGTKDASVALRFSRKLSRHIPQNKPVILKDADHMYSIQKDFDKVMRETADFFKKVLK